MKPVVFFLSLGSNIGDRETYLQDALNHLQQHPEIEIEQLSSIYETDAVGNVDQAPFLNMVVEGKTTLNATALLRTTQKIEQELGRRRVIHWGPRTIDLDILMYNNESVAEQHLVIPHPRMSERAFVLIPLAEIAPDKTIPGETKTIRELAYSVQGEGVFKWKTMFKNGEGVFELSEN
jgi:2-amino-4-hydroxy-6-hydroxymethyldihydropteridine diphosphokinase